VLVLGGTGFVGRHVTSGFGELGHAVWAVVRDRGAASDLFGAPSQVTVIERDLTEHDALADVFKDVTPDLAINCVGYGIDRGEVDEEAAERLNAWLPRRLVEVASQATSSRQNHPVLIHLASDFERRVPERIYGRTKALGSAGFAAACCQLGVRGVIARLFTLYGPGEHSGRLLPSLLQMALGDDTLDLTDGGQLRDFTYVEDVATGVVRLAGADFEIGETVDLGTGENTSVREFASQAALALGIDATRLRFGALSRRDEDTASVARPADVRRMRELTGWRPATTIAAGVTQTARQLAQPGLSRAEAS
jgi:nucleoside-diphosphate-sugar epimerase